MPLLLSLSLCARPGRLSGPIEQPLWSLPAAPGLPRWRYVRGPVEGRRRRPVTTSRSWSAAGPAASAVPAPAAHLALTNGCAQYRGAAERGGDIRGEHQFAHRQWQERQGRGPGGPVCRRTVGECLPRAPD
ncbi:DUF5086 family protein [Pseudomonas aeruginosa]|uniref:DUF5086 family protein n=1 Tax=Pseudomonas aeruginosa TaxID=287 RepID=UPI003D9C3203